MRKIIEFFKQLLCKKHNYICINPKYRAKDGTEGMLCECMNCGKKKIC